MIETKQEFIDSLRRALTGQIDADVLEEHIRYYEDYITLEARVGGSEEAVIKALGDPKLIAMSICAADKAADMKESGTFYTEYEENSRNEKDRNDSRPFILKHPRIAFWAIIALVIVFVILLAVVAFWLLKILWPIILIVLVTVVAVRLILYFRRR